MLMLFNTEQLGIIRACAQECAHVVNWPNELAVYKMVRSRHRKKFSAEQLKVLKFCAKEVQHQSEGAVPVFWSVTAWNRAIQRKQEGARLNLELLHELAALIEPEDNKGGRYRCVTVWVGPKLIGSAPEDIPSDMKLLEDKLACLLDGETEYSYAREPLSADILYEAFETIHPRKHANGREGKIIWNWLMDTMLNPSFPPIPKKFKRKRVPKPATEEKAVAEPKSLISFAKAKLRRIDLGDYVSFGGVVVHSPDGIGGQTQYKVYLIDGEDGSPNLTSDPADGRVLRCIGEYGHYHEVLIHKDDVAEFIARFRKWERSHD
jgi:hypothetical protein